MKPYNIMQMRRSTVGAPGSLKGMTTLAFAAVGTLSGGSTSGAISGSAQLSFSASGVLGSDSGYPSDLPPATITLNSDYGFTRYTLNNAPANTVIDATDSTWIVNNSRNSNPTPSNDCSVGSLTIQSYAVDIQDAGAGLWFYHGRVNGIVPQDSDWSSTYCGSSAAIRCENCPGPGIATGGPTISDVRADRVWDFFRPTYSNGWTVQRVYASYVRDDFIENDSQEGGVVRDCLVDGCFQFMACDPSSNLPEMATQQHMLLDGVLVRFRLSWYGGALTHGGLFKYTTDAEWEANNPRLTIKNCVFAIEKVNHISFSRQNAAWDQLEATGHENNYLVNLTDDALPGNYPLPPGNANFTIINQNGASKQTALDFWEDEKAAWLAAHPHLTT